MTDTCVRTSPVEDVASLPDPAVILAGLRAPEKWLPPALFYDARGAELFEEISELPEYYLTRTDAALMRAHAPALAARIGAGAVVIEPGSGAATKVQPLLAALDAPVAYVPVDVAGDQLQRIAAATAEEHQDLAVLPVCADYMQGMTLPPLPPHARRVIFFPGSTIGNLHLPEAIEFLREMRDVAGPNGGLILGVDRAKDPAVLHAAYNDGAGVTAAFNRNMLAHLNHAFGGTFDLAAFRHLAFFNAEHSRIEMHLVSTRRQTARALGEEIHFDSGESIRTEVSYKYDEPMISAVTAASGWAVVERHTDASGLFWVLWLEPA